MRKLLFANISRLLLNKAFWLTIIIMICAESFFCWILLGQDTPMDYTLFVPLQGIGLLTSVFLSLFLGTEYSDGTIRNKVIVGHKRGNIYLASLFTGIVAITIIYFAEVLTGSVFGIILNASLYNGINKIALAGIVGWLACVSYISIFNLAGMLSSSKARTSIICLLTAFILMLAGLTCALLAGQGFLPTSSIVYLLLFEVNPFGQTFQTVSIDIAAPWNLAAYALILSFILTGFGMYVFHKKDLK